MGSSLFVLLAAATAAARRKRDAAEAPAAGKAPKKQRKRDAAAAPADEGCVFRSRSGMPRRPSADLFLRGIDAAVYPRVLGGAFAMAAALPAKNGCVLLVVCYLPAVFQRRFVTPFSSL